MATAVKTPSSRSSRDAHPLDAFEFQIGPMSPKMNETRWQSEPASHEVGEHGGRGAADAGSAPPPKTRYRFAFPSLELGYVFSSLRFGRWIVPTRASKDTSTWALYNTLSIVHSREPYTLSLTHSQTPQRRLLQIETARRDAHARTCSGRARLRRATSPVHSRRRRRVIFFRSHRRDVHGRDFFRKATRERERERVLHSGVRAFARARARVTDDSFSARSEKLMAPQWRRGAPPLWIISTRSG